MTSGSVIPTGEASPAAACFLVRRVAMRASIYLAISGYCRPWALARARESCGIAASQTEAHEPRHGSRLLTHLALPEPRGSQRCDRRSQSFEADPASRVEVFVLLPDLKHDCPVSLALSTSS